MAKLLIRLKDNSRPGHPSPVHAYRPGDVVAVVPDEHVPGALETGPNFFWVYYPGVPVARFARFVEPEWATLQETWDEDRLFVQRRLYMFSYGLLTAEQQSRIAARSPNALIVHDTTGDVTKGRVNELLINKRTMKSAKGEGRPV